MNTAVNQGETIVFWVCGFFAVLGALGLIFSKKAVHSALWMALTMIKASSVIGLPLRAEKAGLKGCLLSERARALTSRQKPAD